MPPRVKAIAKPELLRWARESAGLDLQTAAHKAKVKPEKLASWESGKDQPTVKQLRKLAGVYQWPLAVFYLPEPPRRFRPLRDFRRLPGEVAGIQSPELRLEVRRAESRREIAIELYEAAEGEPPRLDLTASLSDEPEEVARAIREVLGVGIEEQVSWRPHYETFNRWRSAFEDSGVLVFQTENVPIDELRGFSIAKYPLPAIVVNNKDPVVARIFTLFHEICHIILHQGGLCDLDEDVERPPEEQRIEVFCNMVAGAALVAAENLLREPEVREWSGSTEWPDRDLKALADRYGVSREVILRRLLIHNRITEHFYRSKRTQWYEEYAAREENERREGFAPPHRKAISTAGPLFVQLVLQNYYRENITASDVAEFLGVRLKHLERIESEVMGAARKALR
jgi:Zn-dependent peptidase ImmA (M78 family)/DNA-binding XRE family transcriptional regulator